jgi:hypothetical protein
MAYAHDKAYFEGKARQFFRLAQSCTDPDVAFKLQQLGYEFVGEAMKLGADPATMPHDWIASEG